MTCLNNDPVRATEGTQTREFNFVGNLVDGMIWGATTDSAIGQIINIGAAEEIAIRDLIITIKDATSSSSELQFGSLPPRPTEIPRMKCDNQRAKDILGWTPELDRLVPAMYTEFGHYHRRMGISRISRGIAVILSGRCRLPQDPAGQSHHHSPMTAIRAEEICDLSDLSDPSASERRFPPAVVKHRERNPRIEFEGGRLRMNYDISCASTNIFTNEPFSHVYSAASLMYLDPRNVGR